MQRTKKSGEQANIHDNRNICKKPYLCSQNIKDKQMNEFLTTILPISVVLTFFGTMATIYYTRRNIKTMKYIDTITSERIKWLEIIRSEITIIIENIHFTLEVYSRDISVKDANIYDEINALLQDEHQKSIDSNPPEEDIIVNVSNIELLEDERKDLTFLTSSALMKKENIWSSSDFVKHLSLFKLRLNPEEDKGIIQILNYFIKFYTEEERKSASEIVEAKKNVEKLIVQTQRLLKNEWDKVKKESKGDVGSDWCLTKRLLDILRNGIK